MLGGTLTELAWLRGRIPELRAWLEELGIGHVEVSSGTVQMPEQEKVDLIRFFADGFTVFGEVGEKDPAALLAPYRWVSMIKSALEAGASHVICEGRATGGARLYRPGGEARTRPVDEVVHQGGQARPIFQAPQEHHPVLVLEP